MTRTSANSRDIMDLERLLVSGETSSTLSYNPMDISIMLNCAPEMAVENTSQSSCNNQQDDQEVSLQQQLHQQRPPVEVERTFSTPASPAVPQVQRRLSSISIPDSGYSGSPAVRYCPPVNYDYTPLPPIRTTPSLCPATTLPTFLLAPTRRYAPLELAPLRNLTPLPPRTTVRVITRHPTNTRRAATRSPLSRPSFAITKTQPFTKPPPKKNNKPYTALQLNWLLYHTLDLALPYSQLPALFHRDFPLTPCDERATPACFSSRQYRANIIPSLDCKGKLKRDARGKGLWKRVKVRERGMEDVKGVPWGFVDSEPDLALSMSWVSGDGKRRARELLDGCEHGTQEEHYRQAWRILRAEKGCLYAIEAMKVLGETA